MTQASFLIRAGISLAVLSVIPLMSGVGQSPVNQGIATPVRVNQSSAQHLDRPSDRHSKPKIQISSFSVKSSARLTAGLASEQK